MNEVFFLQKQRSGALTPLVSNPHCMMVSQQCALNLNVDFPRCQDKYSRNIIFMGSLCILIW